MRERARPLFLRSLGLVSLVAFASLGVQIRLLSGSEGILPARELFDRVAALAPGGAFGVAPSLFWLHVSDAALVLATILGGIASLALVLLLAPRLCIAAIWALYLSLAVACGEWLSFQWDNLLVETAFLAFFYAPWGWRPFRGTPPPENAAFRFLIVWLVFRLHVESGVAKIHSGDPSWRDLTAMVAYYETAPIPTALGWWAHQLPVWAHEVSAALTLAAEGLLPFFLFGTRRFRLVALAGIVPFQVFVAATANYGFFNLLSLALCIPALGGRLSLPRGRAGTASLAFAAAVVAITSLDFAAYLARRDLPTALRGVDRAVSPWRTFNTYHLFAVMTNVRDEIEIQGSDDGERWESYEFRYKPGDSSRRPPFVAPHQPRVDFRFWFVPLGPNQQGPLLALVDRLFERPDVVAPLFSRNPFPGRSPRWIRVARWRYTMTSLAERRETGRWWNRTLVGVSNPRARSNR